MADPATAVLGGLAAVAVALAAVTVAWLHLQPADVDPRTDGVSAYGTGRLRSGYRLQVISTGIGALLLAGGLVRAGLDLPAGLALLILFGATRIAIARFPTDLEPPLTPTGQVHALLAGVAFVSVGVAAPMVSLSLVAVAAWHGVQPLLVPLGFAVTASVVATFGSNALPRTRPIFGAVERLWYAATFAWLLVIAVGLVDVST
jgi:hypothetical protein